MQKLSSTFQKQSASRFVPYQKKGGPSGAYNNGPRPSQYNQGLLKEDVSSSYGKDYIPFENVPVCDIHFPEDRSRTKSAYSIWTDNNKRTFKGNFHNIWKNKKFFVMSFKATRSNPKDLELNTTWVVDNSSVRMVQKPLTFALLTQIYADHKRIEYDQALWTCEAVLDRLIKDESIDHSIILSDPVAYAKERRFSEETRLELEGLHHPWEFTEMLMNHPYFASSGVRKLINNWLGHTIHYHPRDEIASITNMIRHKPWLCFFDGLLPYGVSPLTDKDIDQLQSLLNHQLTDIQKQGIIDYHRIKDYQEKSGHITVNVTDIQSWNIKEATIQWLVETGALNRVTLPDSDGGHRYVEAVQDSRRYLAEENVAKCIKRLLNSRPGERSDVCKSICNYLLQKQPLNLSIDQIFALCKILESYIIFMNGGPGRGKTFLEIIAAHIFAFFYGSNFVIITVAGKAMNTIYREKYLPMVQRIEDMCFDILNSQMPNGEGPLRFMDLPEDVVENMNPTHREVYQTYSEYARSRETTKAREEMQKIVEAGDQSTGVSGLNPNYWIEEETQTVFWTHALKKSNCFFPPINNREQYDVPGLDLDQEIRIWARVLNSPLNPRGLVTMINFGLEGLNSDLTKLCDYDETFMEVENKADLGPILTEHKRKTNKKLKPIFPKWMVTEMARNKYDLMAELAAAGMNEDEETEEQLALATGVSGQINGMALKAKPRIQCCNMAEYTFRHRMRGENGITNPYAGTTDIIFDEQMCSLPDISEVLRCTPLLRRLILTGDADQLGAMEKGSLFPQVIQEFRDRGLMAERATLRDITKSRICATLVQNHRVVPGVTAEDGAPQLTPLAVAIEDIRLKKVPEPSADVQLKFLSEEANDSILENDNPETKKKKAKDAVMNMVADVLRERGSEVRIMTPYKDDVTAINRMAYKNQFGEDSLPDSVYRVPLRKGMCVRLTTKAVCWGTFNYSNGDTGEITHIFVTTGKNKMEKRDPSGYGGEPRFFRETDILTDSDWPKAMIVLDHYRLLELSRFEQGSIIPGYACTVHGGQGTESDEVWMVITNSSDGMTSFINNAMVYTAVSRSSKRTGIIATSEMVLRMAINNATVQRMHTRLIALLGISDQDYIGYPEFYVDLCRKAKLTKPSEIIYSRADAKRKADAKTSTSASTSISEPMEEEEDNPLVQTENSPSSLPPLQPEEESGVIITTTSGKVNPNQARFKNMKSSKAPPVKGSILSRFSKPTAFVKIEAKSEEDNQFVPE